MLLKSLIKYKCPNCKKGNIFNSKSILSFGKMNSSCPECSLKYHVEPGFFYGAMYVSYILTVAEGIITYLIGQLFFEKAFYLRIIPYIIGVIIILSTTNFKLSRVLWIHLFLSPKKSNSIPDNTSI